MLSVKNPIMTGFFPDPSICRVGNKFYTVHSTFAYFPGVPVFESEDLVHWNLISNVLDRDSQVPLSGCQHSEGIFAPTIRYHKGTWYMITTNVSDQGNFIVTAKDPRGPWSEPYYLGESTGGIDPSLFFDDDGTCYYIGQRPRSAGYRYNGDCEIWIQTLDLDTMKLKPDATIVLTGFQRKAIWPEGPHLYKKDGYYYILHAESGTSIHHSVMIARSKNVFGPYEYCPCNPILTHRHLGAQYPVTCVGHADLVDDGNGNWYMVVLACRPNQGYTLLGRETFLAKVTWEDGWPVVNAGVGHLEEVVTLPYEGQPSDDAPQCKTYTFDTPSLPLELLTLRNHRDHELELHAEEHIVRLFHRCDSLKDCGEPAYLALRQQHWNCEFEASFIPHFCKESDCAGIAMVQSNENHLRAECYPQDSGVKLVVSLCKDGKDSCLARMDLPAALPIKLKLRVEGLVASVLYQSNSEWKPVISDIDLRSLSTEHAGGFVGCTLGLYASGNGEDAGGYSDFERMTYRELPTN